MLPKCARLFVLIVSLALSLFLRGDEASAQPVDSTPDRGAAKKSMDASGPFSLQESTPAGVSSPALPPSESQPPYIPSPVPNPLSVTPPVTSSPTGSPPSLKKVEVPFTPKRLSPPPEMSKPVQLPTQKYQE